VIGASFPQWQSLSAAEFRFGFFREKDMLVLLAENIEMRPSGLRLTDASTHQAVAMRNTRIRSLSLAEVG
jgi:hypothetical protein